MGVPRLCFFRCLGSRCYQAGPVQRDLEGLKVSGDSGANLAENLLRDRQELAYRLVGPILCPRVFPSSLGMQVVFQKGGRAEHRCRLASQIQERDGIYQEFTEVTKSPCGPSYSFTPRTTCPWQGSGLRMRKLLNPVPAALRVDFCPKVYL